MGAVEKVAHETESEMERLLAVIGGDAGPSEDRLPGIDDLTNLIQQVEAAGYKVTFGQRGEAHSLSPSLGLSVYRILQEALTNFVKHGAGNQAEVVIEYGGDRLALEIRNDSKAQELSRMPEMALGQGLIGMRERVSLFGGRLETGINAGRFVVRADIPVDVAT